MNNKKTVCAIVCEYDPFHSGHAYHISQSRTKSQCDYIVCIMSGSITQRAALPYQDKYTRAKHALQNGADMVIQLPAIYSCGNAELFAQGAIRLVSQLDFVTHLSFGVEKSTTSQLAHLAHIIDTVHDNKSLHKIIQTNNKKGWSYPKALSQALVHALKNTNSNQTIENRNKANNSKPNSRHGKQMLPAHDTLCSTTSIDKHIVDMAQYLDILSTPNNVLGIEYVRACNKYCPHINIITVNRTNSFGSIDLHKPHSSASAIRHHIDKGMTKLVQSYLYCDASTIVPPDTNVYSGILTSHLKDMTISYISNVQSMTEGLEHRLKKYANNLSSIDDIIRLTKTKRYVHSRIRRAIIQSYLGITKEVVNNLLYIPIRVLGIKECSTKLLSMLPIGTIIRYSDICTKNDAYKKYTNTPCNDTTDVRPQSMSLIHDIDRKADNLYSVCAKLDGNLYVGQLVKI